MLINQYPKPKLKKQRKAKNNPVTTINDICRYSLQPFASTHEVFFGRGQRQLSIKYGLQVKVCDRIHKQIHANPLTGLDLELKKEFQQKFIDTYGYNFWMKTFMRDYSGM
jgi:hypothetical protein